MEQTEVLIDVSGMTDAEVWQYIHERGGYLKREYYPFGRHPTFSLNGETLVQYFGKLYPIIRDAASTDGRFHPAMLADLRVNWRPASMADQRWMWDNIGE